MLFTTEADEADDDDDDEAEEEVKDEDEDEVVVEEAKCAFGMLGTRTSADQSP